MNGRMESLLAGRTNRSSPLRDQWTVRQMNDGRNKRRLKWRGLNGWTDDWKG